MSYDPIAGRVSWAKPLLYGNNVDLIIDYFGRAERAPASSEGGYDTYVRFGESKIESIAVNAVAPPTGNYHPSQFQYIVRTRVFKGIECPPFDRVLYLPANNSYLMFRGSTASRIEPSTFSVAFSNAFNVRDMTISGNGENTYIQTGNALSNDFGFHRWSQSSLGIVEDYDPKSFFVGALYPIFGSFGTVTDNNLLAASFSGTNSPAPWYILDMNSRTVLWEGQTSFMLSLDGNFMLKGNLIYSRGNNTWNTLVGIITASEELSSYKFRQGGGVNILYATGGSGALYIFNLNGPVNGSGELPKISHTLSLSSHGYRYDRFSNSFYSIDKNRAEVTVFDADTFQQKTTFSNIWDLDPLQVVYVNGSLFHRNGFVIPKSN